MNKKHNQLTLALKLIATTAVTLFALVGVHVLTGAAGNAPAGPTLAAEKYLFPSRLPELGSGHYWVVDEFGEGPNILDLKVMRWDADLKASTRRRDDVTKDEYDKNPTNDKHLTFGLPLYSPVDGEIVTCWRNAPDNPIPGEKLPAVNGTGGAKKTIFTAGNHVYIKSAAGRVFLVAHMKEGTMPASVCPHNGKYAKDASDRMPSTCPTSSTQVGGFNTEAFVPEGQRPKVKKGQFIGNAGNSGNSSGPHIHVHLRPLTGTDLCPSVAIPFEGAWRQDFSSNKPVSLSAWEYLDGKAITDTVGNSAILPNYAKGLAEVAKHGVPAADYQFTYEHIKGSGYRPVWIDGFNFKGKLYFNVLFRPDKGEKLSAFHNFTAAQYQAEYDKRKGLGYRLQQVDTYTFGNQILYAGFFVKDGGPPIIAYHGLTATEHQKRIDELKATGWLPKNVSVATLNGNRFYTAIYEKSTASFEARSFLSPAEYQKEADDNKAAGRQLVYLNAYEQNGQPRFTAIWKSNIAGSYKARHDLSGKEYQDEWEAALKSGLLTRAVTGYVENNSVRYAAVWRK
ncbi:MAG: hypothetical protein ND895_16450 [Pyrinomonadaceae bacterium]|nr:hypothetical protein [Pyrinomonadaceae bacterium]